MEEAINLLDQAEEKLQSLKKEDNSATLAEI